MRTRNLIYAALFGMISTLSITAGASAISNCRQLARDVQSSAAVASVKDSSGNSTVKAFTDALASYPECKSELKTLWKWNQARDPNVEFPFAKSGDPKNFPLGPISWWWDIIYNKLFGGNITLMFLFGWELFLLPVPFIFVAISIPINMLKTFFGKKGDS